MKKITIPIEFGQPTLTVSINDKEYVLETGKEIEVEDAVAQCVENAIGSREPKVEKAAPSFGNSSPLVLYGTIDNEYPEMYLNDPTYGDEALNAILQGRQILVRIPNADYIGQTQAYIHTKEQHTALFSPVLAYHLPNYENDHLYLFYLRDEKRDLSWMLGQAEGTVQMPVYGQLKMKLSKKYTECPLEHKTPLEYGRIINQ